MMRDYFLEFCCGILPAAVRPASSCRCEDTCFRDTTSALPAGTSSAMARFWLPVTT